LRRKAIPEGEDLRAYKSTTHPTKTRPESILVRLMRVFAFVMVFAHESLALAVEFSSLLT
jgi:hypothetical protein